MKDKKQIACLCFLADLALSVWSYFKVKNYDQYVGLVKDVVDSPDFQVQLYAVILQSVLFSIMIFLLFHLIIYILFLRGNNFASKYVRYYTFLAGLSCLIMLASGFYVGILPLMIYALSFISTGKLRKTKAAINESSSQNLE